MLKKEFDRTFLQGPAGRLPEDRLDIFFLAGGNIRGALIQGTIMVNEMRANHELGIIETLALGHAYLAAGLLTHNLTTGERIALQVDASGPLKGWAVEANAAGETRGYLYRKNIEITAPVESFDLAPFIGIGFLKVTKYLQERQQPFSGQVVLERSNLAEDLAHYFLSSEQIPTAFNLSVHFDSLGRVDGAGGFFLQVLPGAEARVLDELTTEIGNMPSPGGELAAGKAGRVYLQESFSAYGLEWLERKPVRFHCQCLRENFKAYLGSLPRAEIEDMLARGPLPVITTCHNCNSAYQFSQLELEEMLAKGDRG